MKVCVILSGFPPLRGHNYPVNLRFRFGKQTRQNSVKIDFILTAFPTFTGLNYPLMNPGFVLPKNDAKLRGNLR